MRQRLPLRHMMMPVHGCARQGRVERPELEPVQCPRGFERMPVHACARQGRVKRPELEPVQCLRGFLENAGASLTQQGVGNLRLRQRLPLRRMMMPVHGCARHCRPSSLVLSRLLYFSSGLWILLWVFGFGCAFAAATSHRNFAQMGSRLLTWRFTRTEGI